MSTKIRKVSPGLYGTGIYRTAYGSVTHLATTDEVEVVIDRMDGWWYEREMQDDGELTDYCGEGYRTLGAAKASLNR